VRRVALALVVTDNGRAQVVDVGGVPARHGRAVGATVGSAIVRLLVLAGVGLAGSAFAGAGVELGDGGTARGVAVLAIATAAAAAARTAGSLVAARARREERRPQRQNQCGPPQLQTSHGMGVDTHRGGMPRAR